MSDDNTNPTDVEEVVADESPELAQPEQVETPTEETQPEESQEVQDEEPQEESAEEAPEERPPSRREQLRIQTLLAKYGPPQERRNPQPSQPNGALNYQEALDADPEVIRQLEADRQAVSQQQYNAGFEQAKTIQFHTRLEIDAPRVEGKYKFLDPHDRENFDPVRADAMNELYIKSVGYDPGDPQRGIPESVANPNVRYADFVEAQMEFAERLMADRQNQSTKNIAKQAATTGLRPDGSSAKRLNLNKLPQDMTIDELYAVTGGQKPPK
jgi:hypothetical protein